MDVGLSLARRARPRRDRLTGARREPSTAASGSSGPPNYTPRHGPPLGVRAARRHRGRRLPGRPRAHGHRGRAAIDPGRPRRSEQRIRLDRAAQGQLDHQRLPAGLHPDHAHGRPAGRPVGRPAAVHGRARRSSRSGRRSPGLPSRSTSSSRHDSSRRSVAACSSRSARPLRRICSVGRCGRGHWASLAR